MKSSTTKSSALGNLITFLGKLGKISKPKKANAKGVIVYNPTAFVLSELTALAEKAGFSVINTPNQSSYDNRIIPPHVYVGIVNDDFSDDECFDYLSNLD